MNQQFVQSAVMKRAQENLLALKANPYPGRGIVFGLDESGLNFVQIYWIMGRSESSRNRIFVEEAGGLLRTDASDPKKFEGKDTSLIIYPAMIEKGSIYAVSNGHQTAAVAELKTLDHLEDALYNWSYESDAPNNTPRITAVLTLDANIRYSHAEMAILKKVKENDDCERIYFNQPLHEKGIGYCLTTYSGDGDPLPSFVGAPYPLPLTGNIEDVLQIFWDHLDPDNRVSLAVKFINKLTGISTIRKMNKYLRVG